MYTKNARGSIPDQHKQCTLTWSNFNSSSGVSGSCPSVNGGLMLTSLPNDLTTSSLLYLSAKTHEAGMRPCTV